MEGTSPKTCLTGTTGSHERPKRKVMENTQKLGLDKVILIIGLVIYGTGFSLLYVIFAPLSREIGLSINQFGVLIAISNVALVFSSYYWGKRSQLIGRKKVFVIGLLSYGFAFLLFTFGIQVGLWGVFNPISLFIFLLIIRIIYGVLIGGIQPAAVAYMSDHTDSKDRTKGMALIGMAAGIGTMIGPVMGGTLAFIHPLFPMYCGALIALIGAGLAHKYLIQSIPEISESSQNKTLKFYDSRILPFLIGWAVAFMVFTSVQIISAFYIQDQLGITEPDQVIKFTSIALLSMALTSTFMQAVVLQVLNISTETLLRICFLIFGVVLISISLVSSLTQFFLAYAGMGIAFSMITPSLNAAATLSVEPSEQGEVAGFLAGAPVVGMIFGPTIGTLLYNLDPTFPFYYGGLVAIILGAYFQFIKVNENIAD
ncbi:MAG: MFS transporter [Gammaproteobacteria bacterium]|nr:MFS transporter [Gammaproteobacteria bacterium]RZO95162.1 MAG: MFS transporter [Gammaproteobacteria bacterium]